MHNENIPFQLFANCIKVKGLSRSTICDLQRGKIHPIPNSLYELLDDYEGKTFAQVKDDFDHQYDEVIDEYISFLLKEDLIFFSDQLSAFPKLSIEWSASSLITNCIIDIDTKTKLDIEKIIGELNDLNCSFLQFRIYNEFDLSFYQTLLNAIENSTITSVELILPDNDAYSEIELMAFCDKNKRITSVLVHGSDRSAIVRSPDYSVPIHYSTNSIINQTCCGIISMQNFVVNSQTFMESQSYNTCLNNKISIDSMGYIKNCPSMSAHFGNVKDTTLQEALGRTDFKELWKVSKNQISTCKECEFRHVCTDCRAYIEDPEDELSKPLKCGYNPNSCTWENWSQNPLKQLAIEYYGLKTII